MRTRRWLSVVGLVGLVVAGGTLQVLLLSGLRQVARDLEAVRFAVDGASRPARTLVAPMYVPMVAPGAMRRACCPTFGLQRARMASAMAASNASRAR